MNYYGWARQDVKELLPSEYARVLEIGCGEGGFKTLIGECSFYRGVEPNPDAAAVAKKNGLDVLEGDYEDVADEIPSSSFDLVICNDVIEHMKDHDDFLESVKDKIQPNGYIVGSVPNILHIKTLFRLLFLKDWRYEESGVLDRTHLRFFTKKSLRRTFINHGYSIDEIRGLKPIVRKPTNLRDVGLAVLGIGILVISAGYYRDVLYLQHGFRVRWNGTRTDSNLAE